MNASSMENKEQDREADVSPMAWVETQFWEKPSYPRNLGGRRLN